MSHKNYRNESNCLNCGANVVGKFCSTCGQENIEIRESFSHMAGHFIADYFHYDSKFFKGLLPLFTKPGYLTKQYLEGKRVSNIHPMRLFFFATILMVLVTSYYYKRFEHDIRNDFVKTGAGKTVKDSTEYTSGYSFNLDLGDSGSAEEEKAQRDKFYAAVDHFFHNIKYVSFFMLPVYALIFKLLFVRRKTFYVDHLVYTLHVQSFLYIVVSVMLLVPLLIAPDLKLKGVGSVVALIYITLSLRYLYQQAWWKTILKSLAATGICLVLTSVVLIAYVITLGLH